MGYLGEQDYGLLIRQDNLNQIIDSTEQTPEELANGGIIGKAERVAITEVRSYLAPLYDVALEFTKQSTEPRNELLVMYVVDVALYHLHSRINPRQVPEKRQIRYDSAISWLNKASKGIVMVEGLTRNVAAPGNQRIGFGSNLKQEHRY